MKKVLFLVASFIIVLVSLFALTSQHGDYKTNIALGEDSYMEGISIEQKKSGNLIWRLEARKAIHINAEDIRLEDISVLLPEKGLKIKAHTAYYSLKTKDFKIPENIDVSARDFDIKGAGIYWDAQSNTLKSDKDIKILGKGFTIEGSSLTATTDKARIEENVKAVFYGK